MVSEYISSLYKVGVRMIRLNRPEKKNAMTQAMYLSIANILNSDAKDDDIVTTIITGVGDYFTSGNDISSAIVDFQDVPEDSRSNSFRDMVLALINYPKLIISVVNGPAVGIGSTILGLCDIVYASEKAVFDTPFVKLGLCAEGASSFTFPYILGRSKASEVILLNHKLSAQEAYNFGLVSKVIPHESLSRFIEELHQYGKLPVNSLKRNKELLMQNLRKSLLESNERELEMLNICVNSEEFTNAVMAFLARKSKL